MWRNEWEDNDKEHYKIKEYDNGKGEEYEHKMKIVGEPTDVNNEMSTEGTPWSKVLLVKLMVTKLVKKLSAFYGTRRSQEAATSPVLSQMNSVHIF